MGYPLEGNGSSFASIFNLSSLISLSLSLSLSLTLSINSTEQKQEEETQKAETIT